jgi:hypothetical protein
MPDPVNHVVMPHRAMLAAFLSAVGVEPTDTLLDLIETEPTVITTAAGVPILTEVHHDNPQ